MRRLLTAVLLFCGVASAMQRVQVTCSKGGQTVTVLTYTSTTKVMASYPGCSATVYITGSSPLTKATIYADNLGTALSNPFTTQDSTNGAGYFYVADGIYDVQISGGGLSSPYTFGSVTAGCPFTATGTGAVTRSCSSKLSDIVSVRDFGAIGDGSTDDTVAITEAFTAASGKGLYFPAGTYKLNNSTAGVVVSNWSGKFYGDGNTSIIACTSLGNDCLTFLTATSMTVENIAFTFTPARTTRNGSQLLVIRQSDNITLNGITAHNGNSVALLVEQCTNVNVSNLLVYDMLANGLLLTNSSRVSVSGIICNNVEDYCVEASQYDPGNGVPGGTCQFVNVTNMESYGSFSGMLFNGCPDSSLSNFSIYNTYSPAVAVTQDSATTTAAFPNRISVSNGSVKNTGVLASTNKQAQCIWLKTSNAPSVPLLVSISNVTLQSCAADGIETGSDTLADPSWFNLMLNNITVDGTGQYGVGYRFSSKGSVSFSNLQARNTYGFGMYISGVSSYRTDVTGTNLLLYNVVDPAKGDPRAFYANNIGSTLISGLQLIDDRATAYGYQIADGGSGNVHISNIWPTIVNGTYATSPGSANSEYFLFDFYKRATSFQADVTGNDCQLTASGLTDAGQQTKVCFDTTGNFGWIQAGQNGVANRQLRLNPNGGGLSFGTQAYSDGGGTPEGSVTGSIGDWFVNKAGGKASTAYIKYAGSASTTGWQPLGFPSGVQGGSTTPNGFVTGSPGDLFINYGGGAGTTLWVKESGSGTNTGWVGK